MSNRVTVTLSLPATEACISALLEGLTQLNQVIRRSEKLSISGAMPLLYQSGVRYKREPIGAEEWQPVDKLFANKAGDCEDLAAARAAELRELGKSAQAVCVRRGRGFYCVVIANGEVEDPSKKIGMGKK